jgi:deoxyribose-phosphate aldolase
MALGLRELAAMIDHTLLRPEATPAHIRAVCAEARAWRVASVCLNPCYVALAARELEASEVNVCTVVGFPLGANRTEVKRAEAEHAVADGAAELDMVIAIGRLKDGDSGAVRADIEAVVRGAGGRLVKVILETALLEFREIELGCRLAMDAGAAFAKTSTGFGPGGASVDDVALMRRVVGSRIGVKAAGGIRDAATARALIDAGASRLGCSATGAILAGWEDAL